MCVFKDLMNKFIIQSFWERIWDAEGGLCKWSLQTYLTLLTQNQQEKHINCKGFCLKSKEEELNHQLPPSRLVTKELAFWPFYLAHTVDIRMRLFFLNLSSLAVTKSSWSLRTFVGISFNIVLLGLGASFTTGKLVRQNIL